MGNKRQEQASWYSITLNLGRVTEVVPASQKLVLCEPDDVSQTSSGYNQVPVTRYRRDQ